MHWYHAFGTIKVSIWCINKYNWYNIDALQWSGLDDIWHCRRGHSVFELRQKSGDASGTQRIWCLQAFLFADQIYLFLSNYAVGLAWGRFNRNPGNVVLAGTRAKQKKACAYGTRTDATYRTRWKAYGMCQKLRADARNIFRTSRGRCYVDER